MESLRNLGYLSSGLGYLSSGLGYWSSGLGGGDYHENRILMRNF